VVAAAAAGLLVIGYLGAQNHPEVLPVEGISAERQITEFYHREDGADFTLNGDLLIERFYIYNLETGQYQVADLCKGRVKDVFISTSGDWSVPTYQLLLERRGLERERARIASFVAAVTPVEAEPTGTYLGLRVQGGMVEAFNLNYDGSLPAHHAFFTGPAGEDVFSFLATLNYDVVTAGVPLVNIEGNNYLLSNTDRFPYLRDLFQVRGVFLAQLILVDATSDSRLQALQTVGSQQSTNPP
jgi:hypothetical protein